jgi:putative ABC transport system permease protein
MRFIIFLKIFFQQVGRNPRTFLINLFGLSIGMACSFIILLYVIGETSYERFQDNKDQVFRVLNQPIEDKSDNLRAINYSKLSQAMRDEIPEINYTTILEARVDRPFYIISDNEYITETGTIYEVEPDYFSIFTVHIINGQRNNLLDEPNQLILSKEKKNKYFGTSSALGKTMTFVIDDDEITYTIVAIMDKIPGKSAFLPDFIVPFDEDKYANIVGWEYVAYQIFMSVNPQTDIGLIENKLSGINKKYTDEEEERKYILQNLSDIHLGSEKVFGSHLQKGHKTSILIFSLIGIVILLIACINYILLATAESSLRLKEIGIKKVLGASRISLILKLQAEAQLKVFLALPLALFFVERSKDFVERYFGQELLASYSNNQSYILGFIAIAVLVGCISGIYLSIKLSKLQPSELIAGINNKRKVRAFGRKTMIGFQLFTFIVLFSSMLIMRNQIKHAMSLNAELKLDRLFEIKNYYQEIKNIAIFKERLEEYPDVISVSSAFSSVFERNMGRNNAVWNKYPENEIAVEQYYIDPDYTESIGIHFVSGEGFKAEDAPGKKDIIVNQKFVDQLGIANPIGEVIQTRTIVSSTKEEYRIIGVLENFVSGSAHQEIGPQIIFRRPAFLPSRQILIKTKNGITNELSTSINELYSELSNNKPLIITSLKEQFGRLYQKENLLSRIISAVAYLAIFISCLGLFGLSLFMARSKNKEIGIRKVFGANNNNIIFLIMKDFVPIILLSNIIAIPFTILIMKHWLNDFAYKVTISPWLFAMALVISLIIVGLTLMTNAQIVANTNPSKTLRQD